MSILHRDYQIFFQISFLNVQPPVWFSLGCAAMATGQLDLAQSAFQRYVTLDPDVSYQSYNFCHNHVKREIFFSLSLIGSFLPPI